MPLPRASRRQFLQRAATLGAALAIDSNGLFATTSPKHSAPLGLFGYADVTLASDLCQRQLDNTHPS